MNVNFKIRGVEKVQKYLKELPRGVTRVALQAMSEWFIGDSQSGLRHPEPYKYVTRKSAYGTTFFTEKQRRWFWANGGPDMIGDHRTGKSAEAWTYKPAETNKGYNFRLINPTPGAYYTRDDYGQARQPAKVGWKKVSAVISKNMAGAIKAANFAVNSFLKSKK